MPAALTQIQRSTDRFVTSIDWLHGRHSFSFGPHYDPKNTHHGLLLVNNEDVVRPGTGFRTHPHQDMEIVTPGCGRRRRGVFVWEMTSHARGW
jgi:redox-sensitive bicupin YhaK (pirin superfamily)